MHNKFLSIKIKKTNHMLLVDHIENKLFFMTGDLSKCKSIEGDGSLSNMANKSLRSLINPIEYTKESSQNAKFRMQRKYIKNKNNIKNNVIEECDLDDMTKKIFYIFSNTGKTDWSIPKIGNGMRRLYPSNGAVHSLYVEYVSIDGRSFTYNPNGNKISFKKIKSMKGFPYINIYSDLEKVNKRYNDARSYLAIYIEMGSAILLISKLIEPFKIKSIKFKDINNQESDDSKSLCLARIDIAI